jgi:hypothetical protein
MYERCDVEPMNRSTTKVSDRRRPLRRADARYPDIDTHRVG